MTKYKVGTFIGRSRFSHNGTLVKNSHPPEIFMLVKIFYHVASFCHREFTIPNDDTNSKGKVLALSCSYLNTAALVQRNVENLAGLSKQYWWLQELQEICQSREHVAWELINTSDKYAETFTRL